MKADQNTAAILLDKLFQCYPYVMICISLCGGRTAMWNTPAINPRIPAAIWCDATPLGLNGLNPSGPQAGATGCTLPVIP